jgi:hypothetical protein
MREGCHIFFIRTRKWAAGCTNVDTSVSQPLL